MPKQMLVPQLNPNDMEMQVVEWHVQDGDPVEVGDIIITLETAKANIDVESDCEGFILTTCKTHDIVSIGRELARFYDSLNELTAASNQQRDTSTELSKLLPNDNVAENTMRFSQSALAYIEAEKIDKEIFRGMGLVTLTNVKQTVAASGLRREPILLSKQQEIQILIAGQQGGVNSSITVQFDSQPIRERLSKAKLLDGEILPFILFSLAYTIRQIPVVNAYYESQHIVYHKKINIGVAMDMGHGLKVPVIQQADTLTPHQLFQFIKTFSSRYRKKQLQTEDLQAATFTVSDLSNDDVIHFQPLLAPKQAAILGIGGNKHRAGHPMTLTLVFDHRVLSGRDAAQFLNALKERLTIEGRTQ